MDGFDLLKRKVFYAITQIDDNNQFFKLCKLTGQILGNTDFFYGDCVAQQIIIKMAQNYVGTNNINLLEPQGQFGTRYMAGKDYGYSKYLYTKINQITQYIFLQQDQQYLNQIQDTGSIEPELYYPIIPMVLVNGCQGIGMGFSTYIPCFNPLDIIQSLENKLNGQNFEDLKPWYKGFKGKQQIVYT